MTGGLRLDHPAELAPGETRGPDPGTGVRRGTATALAERALERAEAEVPGVLPGTGERRPLSGG